MDWWIWAIAGAALMALELTLPTGFVLISFGVGAIAAALAAATGILPHWMEWAVFGAVSIASVFGLRAAGLGPSRGRPIAHTELSDLIGEVAVPTEDLPAGGTGRAELRGTSWTARNAGVATIARGTRCRVEKVESIVLWIRPE